MHQLGKCSQKVELDAAERNWTLTVTNPLGKLELHDRVDLTKRGKTLEKNEGKKAILNL